MKKGKTETPPPGDKKRPRVHLKRPDDVRRLLSRLINQTMTNEFETEKLRAISYSCQVVLKCFEIDLVQQPIAEIRRDIEELRATQ